MAMIPAPRICFLSFCPSHGGIAAYQANHIRWLVDVANVSLVDEFPDLTLGRLCPHVANAVEVFQIPLWSDQRRTQLQLLEWLRQQKPTVIAISNPGVLVRYFLVLQWFRRQTNVKIVQTLHSGTLLTKTARRFVLELLSGVLVALAADRVFVSDFTRNYWHLRYPWLRHFPSRVIPNGVFLPTDMPPRQMSTGRLRVGFVGRIVGEKDPLLFCQVARQAHHSELPFEFHVYGAGPQMVALQHEFGDLIQWHNHVESAEEIFGALDILMMTSPVENCPYALLEAKSYGVLAVVAPVGGLPEIVMNGKDGVIASARTTSALLDALVTAGANRMQLMQGCLETRHSFDMRSVGARMWGAFGIG